MSILVWTSLIDEDLLVALTHDLILRCHAYVRQLGLVCKRDLILLQFDHGRHLVMR